MSQERCFCKEDLSFYQGFWCSSYYIDFVIGLELVNDIMYIYIFSLSVVISINCILFMLPFCKPYNEVTGLDVK